MIVVTEPALREAPMIHRTQRLKFVLSALVSWSLIRFLPPLGVLLILATPAQAADPAPLSAWSEGPNKQAIIEFVTRTTDAGSRDFLPIEQRIAVFDHDGTLAPDKPFSSEIAFVFDRTRQLAPQFPGWRQREPFRAAVEGRTDDLSAQGPAALMQLNASIFAGMATPEYTRHVLQWMPRSEHPRFHRPYSALTYLPMLQLLDFLRSKGFKTWIVSSTSADFLRAWSESSYGVPPEQVIGSTVTVKLEVTDTHPLLIRMPQIESITEGENKAVAIHRQIGRRPVLAFGNSDTDLPMLQWTAAGAGPRLIGIIHHTDSAREYAYGSATGNSTLNRGLDLAKRNRWLVVDMHSEWTRLFRDDIQAAPQP